MSDGAIPCRVAGMPHEPTIWVVKDSLTLFPPPKPVLSEAYSFTVAGSLRHKAAVDEPVRFV